MHRRDVCSHRLSVDGAKFGFAPPLAPATSASFFPVFHFTFDFALCPSPPITPTDTLHPPPPCPCCDQINCMLLHNVFLNHPNAVKAHSMRAKRSMSRECESEKRRTKSPANRVEEGEGEGEPHRNKSSLENMKSKIET